MDQPRDQSRRVFAVSRWVNLPNLCYDLGWWFDLAEGLAVTSTFIRALSTGPTTLFETLVATLGGGQTIVL